MASPENQANVIEHLEAALAADDQSQKNYHIRQALQLLGIG